jgi:hypothetical protein
MYIYNNETIYVADSLNHRIVVWIDNLSNGQVVAGGNGAGDRDDQLNNPTNVIADKKDDCLTICDYGNRRVVKWSRQNGTCGETIISNIGCSGLIMDNNGYIYVSNLDKHEVRRWNLGDTYETIVAGGHGQGSRLDQLSSPFYIFVNET